MPFAGYKDFDACVAAQKKKGHSDESAHRICGAIKQKVEGSITEEELDSIKMELWVQDCVLNSKKKDK